MLAGVCKEGRDGRKGREDATDAITGRREEKNGETKGRETVTMDTSRAGADDRQRSGWVREGKTMEANVSYESEQKLSATVVSLKM